MQLNLFKKQKGNSDLANLFIEKIGRHGRLLNGSKTEYIDRHPQGFPIFNANVIDRKGQKVWFGDLDLVADFLNIGEIVKEHNAEFLILKEHDARFGEENKTYKDLKAKAIVLVTPTNLYFPSDRITKKWIQEDKI